MFERGSSWANASKSNHPSFSSAEHVFTSPSHPFPLKLLSWCFGKFVHWKQKKKCWRWFSFWSAANASMYRPLLYDDMIESYKHAGFIEDQMIQDAYPSSAQCFPWLSSDVQGFEYVSRWSTCCRPHTSKTLVYISHTISDCFNGHRWRKLDVIYRMWVKALDLLCCFLRHFEGTLLHHHFFFLFASVA